MKAARGASLKNGALVIYELVIIDHDSDDQLIMPHSGNLQSQSLEYRLKSKPLSGSFFTAA